MAAGKMVAERTRLAREEQKKPAEAYQAEKAATAAPEPAPTTEDESPKSGGGLSANQWIPIGGIGVSLLGIYYKREELKAMAKPISTNSKRRSLRLSPRVPNQSLLARHSEKKD